jgi:FKBP-type peptidyl-prolyl cis-trans isomerase
MPSANVLFSSTDLALGTGATAVAGKRLTVHYTGWLYDGSSSEQKGRQFESTFGKKPLSFVLGQGEIIQGGERGVEGMNVGGRRRVVIPPDLAFGDAGDRGNVPPNATLIYEVELIGVQ